VVAPSGVDTLKSTPAMNPAMGERESESLDEAYATDVWARRTAPQSPYRLREVGIGLVVFGIVAVVAYGLPLALT
jgi:hypothetical protein